MPFNDNPALAQIMSGVDLLVQNTEQKRRENKSEQLLTEERSREDTLLKKKRQLGVLQNVMENPSIYTENSVSTATGLYTQLLDSEDETLRGGFTPKLRPQTTKELEQRIDPKIAKSLNLDPNTLWSRTEREMLTDRYKSESQEDRKLTETERHNRALEARRAGGGFSINVGGQKYSADKALDQIKFYEGQADKLFLSGFKGTSEGGTVVGTRKVSRRAYEEYKVKLDDFKKAIENDTVTPEMLQEIEEIQPFIVDEKEFMEVEDITKSIIDNSPLINEKLDQLLKVK